MNKNFDFVSVLFCITVICLLIPATRKPIIKFIKPLFESDASNEDYKRKLLDEYTKETRNGSWGEWGRTGNEKDPITDHSKSDVIDLINDPNFMPGASVANKLGTVADKTLGKTYKTVDYSANLRGTIDYAESIAESQNFYLDEYGNVVNEKPNVSEHRYKLIIYGGVWAYQLH